ncbi:hypothetical protein ANCDUO_01196 [Ancylostoma duodenale]|uniref:Uncharacterized protein n=1 Tax=Ancylostoma duodenale TaxID=51022 RepID=A0A0C2H9Z6_9BILA|nr:hypothetical protein ANCDUO_01196 [Ancylostoma duodenale]
MWAPTQTRRTIELNGFRRSGKRTPPTNGTNAKEEGDLYNEHAKKMKEMLSGAYHISFTTDNVHSVLSLTAHFIDKNMRPKFVVMAVSPLKERHTAENMQSKIAKALSPSDAAKKGLQLISAVDDGADSLIGPVFKIVRKMKKGIEVHWDSIYDMLTRILEVRRVLELFLLDHRNYPQLDAEDWELIKKIV